MAQLVTADVLERCAGELHSVAFDWREPARSTGEVERRIAEVERIVGTARAAVRGRVTRLVQAREVDAYPA